MSYFVPVAPSCAFRLAHKEKCDPCTNNYVGRQNKMATAKRIKGHHKKIIGGGKTKWRLPTELKATTKIN